MGSAELRVPAASQGLIEATGLAGGFVGMNDAFGGSLVVKLLGLVPDLCCPLGVTSVDGSVEALREVLQMSAYWLVLFVLPAVLLITLGWCGHLLKLLLSH